MNPDNIFLVGPMGVGKSTIGRVLAKRLDFEFIDLDAEIEASCGADIAWVFDVEGEEGFRQRESQALDKFSRRKRVVMATGGGAVLKDQNRSLLRQRGAVIYLKASVDQLYERTRLDKKRPLLQVEDPKAVIEKLVKEREPLYESIADLVIETEKKNPQAVAAYIESRLLSH